MAYVDGFEHDIFLSYARVDDQTASDAGAGWVTAFEKRLQVALDRRVGRIGVVKISPSELDLVRKQTHFHTYYDNKRKIKIGVSCSADGAPLSVGFSSKYYGM